MVQGLAQKPCLVPAKMVDGKEGLWRLKCLRKLSPKYHNSNPFLDIEEVWVVASREEILKISD